MSELDQELWTARADAYARRVDAFVAPHVERARAGEAHPVWDFLFSYYSLRPGQLRCWHPGYGVLLVGSQAIRRYRGRRGYTVDGDGVTVSLSYLRDRLDTISFVARLLRATARRPARLNCFGLHEWAMVYHDGAVRHERVPLRLGAAGTDAVVEGELAGPLRCSHYDAFRFFSSDAVPRNAGVPSRATQQDWEQPGCLHANMDLYKWCYKVSPLIDSELLMDCLELATAAREIDMRASPYDLRGYGCAPIAVEHAAGRAEYVRCQQAIAARAAPLRAALLDRCDLLLQVAQVPEFGVLAGRLGRTS
ncbi:3-methyladenine DNA glycosylase [Candidatus Mycobacterium methanotrophicum]|uniref:3-methyladenine DNA glycosylase n=1 Tax=Candidatus Mycobacterium methanotrophicum TaxID=2943498 RepID=A0ABY4QGA8_9MYCO|nr:3-methyladenine DNA glycosylase [Candidatus Mycobacterium methanotrophicum]UQX09869.1 3-methyladenine DNA glycosylase [Candidatus Mycobacterium methanotrophicum]